MGSLWNKVADTFNRTRNGTVPKAPEGDGNTHYLCEDGTWKEVQGGGGETTPITSEEIAIIINKYF